MLILHGKAKWSGPWAQIELTSDARLEEVTLHLIRWIAKHDDPAQVLFPVASRGLYGVELLYPNILIRSKGDLSGIRSVMGIQGLALTATGQPMELDEDFVQSLIKASEDQAGSWSEGIKVGSFVRILFGNTRMLCGTVTKLANGIADVIVSLAVRDVRVRIPVRALQLLKVRKGERRYYHNG
jgi:hypothetical protein